MTRAEARKLYVGAVMTRLMSRLKKTAVSCSLLLLGMGASANLQTTPAWYGASSTAASQWHYRVPLTVPSGTVAGHTVTANLDFSALLSQMGIGGTFDVNSPRIVTGAGSLVPVQEFTDSVYNGATDATGNARGEVRFTAPGADTSYYVYFDVTQNGTKPSNPQPRLGGNFEASSTGTQSPAGWTGSKANSAFDTQVRPSETPSIPTDGNVTGNGSQPRTVDGTPLTGQFSYLLGSRSANEPVTVTQATVLSRTITVPATAPGSLTFKYRVQGWDSGVNNEANNYDYLDARIIDGSSNQYLVGPLANNYTSLPFSPNQGGNQASSTQSGYGQYNGFDTSTNGTHRAGMTVARGAQPWWTVTVDLAPYAGKTVTLRFSTRHTVLYRSWWHLDDVEWSTRAATVGVPEGFGAEFEPIPATGPGQQLSVRLKLDAQGKTGAVVGLLYSPSGALAATIPLYDNGTNGDATAGDGWWSNSAAYTFPTLTELGNWTLVGRALDSSTANGGQLAGLVKIPGQANSPVSEATFYNVDETLVPVTQGAALQGSLYEDSNADGVKSPGESGISVPGNLWVKLLNGAGTAVLAVSQVSPAGEYSFAGVAPGSYKLQVDDNSTAADLVPVVPVGYSQSEPGLGQLAHTVVLAAGPVVQRNFGYALNANVAKVIGRVYFDEGAGGATALDGVFSPSEQPVGGQSVELVGPGGSILAQTTTSAAGDFSLVVPPGTSGPLTVRLPLSSTYLVAGIQPGTSGGSGNLPQRSLSFAYSTGSVTGILFQAIRPPLLTASQTRTVLPGVSVQYGHQLTTPAEGNVTLSLVSTTTGSAAWAAVLYRDLDCSGTINGADAPLAAAATPVTAGGVLCVVVLDNVPGSAAVGASAQHFLSAVYSKNAWTQSASNTDITIVGPAAQGTLRLLKEVRNVSTNTAWSNAGPALPGQQIEYRLTYANDTSAPVSTVELHDSVPAYTVLLAVSCGAQPAGVSCAVTQAPAFGATSGTLKWTLTGSVPAGAAGSVLFTLVVQN